MRAAILVCLAIAGVPQSARATEITFNPGAPGAWTVSGGSAEAAGERLTLPAGGRISHSFATDRLSVLLMTSPKFGAEAEEWPVIEIGAAALAFTRNGDEGRIVLLSSKGDAMTLPYAPRLNAAGYPVEAVELEFSVEGKVVSIVHGRDETHAAFEPSPTLEVAVSAGAHQSWEFERFVVEATDSTPPPAADQATSGDSDSTGSGKAAGHQASGSAGHGNEAKTTIFSPATTPNKAAAARPLEVFTPPSVRQRIAEHLSTPTNKSQR